MQPITQTILSKVRCRPSLDSLEPSPSSETSGARIVRLDGFPHHLDEAAASIPVRPERHSVFPPGTGIERRYPIERAIQAGYRVSGNRSAFAAIVSGLLWEVGKGPGVIAFQLDFVEAVKSFALQRLSAATILSTVQ